MITVLYMYRHITWCNLFYLIPPPSLSFFSSLNVLPDHTTPQTSSTHPQQHHYRLTIVHDVLITIKISITFSVHIVWTWWRWHFWAMLPPFVTANWPHPNSSISCVRRPQSQKLLQFGCGGIEAPQNEWGACAFGLSFVILHFQWTNHLNVQSRGVVNFPDANNKFTVITTLKQNNYD